MILSLARSVVSVIRKVRIYMLREKKGWVKCRTGFWIYVDLRSCNDIRDQWILFGTYEQALVHSIKKLVRPGEICFDVGAERGYITLHLARAVGSGGHVLAFEPDPRAASILSLVVKRNKIDSIVKIFQCALADKEGKSEIFLSSWMGQVSFFPNELQKPLVTEKISVPTLTMDQVIEEAGISGNVSLIKIDAEGSEPLILKGMSRTIERFRPAIYLEINRPSLRAGNFPLDAIESPLRQAGYDLYRLVGFRDHFLRLKFSLIAVHNLPEVPDELFDILAVPRDPAWKARLDALRQ